MNLLDLPHELLVEIFQHVDAGTLLTSVPQTCHLLKELSILACRQKKSLHISTQSVPLKKLQKRMIFDINYDYEIIVNAKPSNGNHDDKNGEFHRLEPTFDLFTNGDLSKFVEMFPNIISLTITGPQETHCDPIILKLIESYPALVRLQCYGRFDLIDTLRELKQLKHFVHLSHVWRDHELDRTYMLNVPEVFQRLDTLQLYRWSGYDLPCQLKNFCFEHYPPSFFCQKPENYMKAVATTDPFFDFVSYKPCFELIKEFKNVKHFKFKLHLTYSHCKRNSNFSGSSKKFYKLLFDTMKDMPQLEVLYLIECFPDRAWNDNLPEENKDDPTVDYEALFNQIANHSPFVNIKHIKFDVTHSGPMNKPLLSKLFPNAHIDFQIIS